MKKNLTIDNISGCGMLTTAVNIHTSDIHHQRQH